MQKRTGHGTSRETFDKRGDLPPHGELRAHEEGARGKAEDPLRSLAVVAPAALGEAVLHALVLQREAPVLAVVAGLGGGVLGWH